ncbi:response regulator transcription factor [Pigmentiphaga aceris]|uniref:Response regulator transcription factor n=1 Tax=Pigmentiphaga aceris TaxID=1940612 RepID=A0A5C0AZJ6_9BURK|nr:response regulator transcription factor [Pigmentiphaga aceris]QEI06280.1 response regulator transcription factor [Pigmentiphaga aceris]
MSFESLASVTTSTRILLVDDHPLVRDGLRARLDAMPNVTVVGEAENASEALRLADSVKPHLTLMDIGMKGVNGIELAGLFHARFPDIAVVMLSMHGNLEYVRQTAQAGARGYVLKDAPAHEIVTAIDTVMNGGMYYSAAIAARLVQATASTDPRDTLTARENDILARIGRGMANKQIAAEVGLSVRTVETHRLNIKRKLGIEGQAELIRYAVENCPE